MGKSTCLALLSGCIFLFFSCNNKKTPDSPFGEILSSRPFDGLTDSIRKDPGNDSLYFKRAILLNTHEFSEPALADFRKAWSLRKDERYAFGQANLLLEKKPDSAIIFLNDAIKELPNSLLLQISLGRALLAQNKTTEALQLADRILAKHPEKVDILKMKAEVLERTGNRNGSINVLQQAYQLTPFDVELNYMLALRLAETGNSRVLALCDSLLKADSMGIHAEPFYYKGIYYSVVNNKTKALENFDAAIKKDYYFLDGYIEKGALYYEMKQYQQALGVFNLCLTVSPKFADAYYWIAKCQEAMGQKEEAKANYERAYILDNNLKEAKTAADKFK